MRNVYQYTEIRVQIIVDHSVILKENYCDDARTSYSHDSVNTTIDSLQVSVNTERKKNQHNGGDMENDYTKHAMCLKKRYFKDVKRSHSSEKIKRFRHKDSKHATGASDHTNKTLDSNKEFSSGQFIMAKDKMEKKSSSDNIRINSDNVNRCKTGEHNRHKRKERTENMPIHGNAKAKHIPTKTTMIGRSKKTGSIDYKNTGNSEENNSSALIKKDRNSKEKSSSALTKMMGNSEENSSSSFIKTVGQTVKKHIPIPDPIKRFGHFEDTNIGTASNKVRHLEEYCMSTSTKTNLNSESAVFNSLETDRGCGYQTGPDKTNSRINYYSGHYCIDATLSESLDIIQTFSGNTDTSDMMYHGKRLTSDAKYHEIKKNDLLTGTRSPNRSLVRSIQEVSHMNHKIGNCKDREEKNYESPISPGNKHTGCKSEEIFINNKTLLTKNLISKLKDIFKNVTVTPKQQYDVYGDRIKHAIDIRKIKTEHCFDFDIRKVKIEPRDDFDVRKDKNEPRDDFDVKKVKIEHYDDFHSSTEHSKENFEIRKVKSEPLDLCNIKDIKLRDSVSIGSRKVKSEPSLNLIDDKTEIESREDTPLQTDFKFDDLTTGDNPNRNSNETEHQVLENEIVHGEYEDDNFIVIDEWHPENDDTEVKSEK